MASRKKQTTRLVVYPPALREGVAPPTTIPLETRIPVSEGARESILWHGIAARYYLTPFVDAKLDHGVRQRGFEIYLNKPFTAGEAGEEIRKAIAMTDPEYAKTWTMKAAAMPRRKFSLLSNTSKMGCWSFNLLAGPTQLGGTCPMAAPGFMFLSPEQQTQAGRGLRPETGAIRPTDYLCNGCYAIKGQYSEYKVVLGHVMKQRYALRLLRSGQFVDAMVTAITAARAQSKRRRASAPPALRWTVNHPDYFRIHDSGDFFDDGYIKAWIEIMNAFPDVHFWAPTRMLYQRGGALSSFKKRGIPSNLALRPSGLHFGDPAPAIVNPGTASASFLGEQVPGLAAGSGAIAIDHSEFEARPRRKLEANEWLCPATQHWTELGGSPTPPKHAKGPKYVAGYEARRGKEQETAYSCALAHGPLSPARGGNDPEHLPENAGCRACWRLPHLAIYYGEH